MKSASIKFKDSKFNYETSISMQTTTASLKEYFEGQYFDMGVFPNEDMQQCISAELI